MSLAFIAIAKTSPGAVRDESDYQDPASDLHITKSKGRDPHGDRRSELFWVNCTHSSFHKFSSPLLVRSEVTEELVALVAKVKDDDRNRRRKKGVLRKLIWNPPTELMAEWRAIQEVPVRALVSREMFLLFNKEVCMMMPGPRIIDSHPDRHRFHIEGIVLFFDPATNERFPWASGMKMDGTGSTTLAEDPNSKMRYFGLNSRLAAIMAESLRETLASYKKTLTPEECVGYDLRVTLQHVLLETTMAKVSADRRRQMERKRPAWLQALCKAWVAAPGSKRMERKIQFYHEKGLVTAEAFPFLPDIALELPNFNRWAARGSRQTTPGAVPKPERVEWLRIWLNWIKRNALLPFKKQKARGLRVVETLVRIDRDRNIIELKREVFWEVAEAVDHGLLSSEFILEFGENAVALDVSKADMEI